MVWAVKWPQCAQCGRRHDPDLERVDHYGRNRALHALRSRRYRGRTAAPHFDFTALLAWGFGNENIRMLRS